MTEKADMTNPRTEWEESDWRWHLEQLFTEQEKSLIWAALQAYDIGHSDPSDVNPQLFLDLETLRQRLVEVFE